jgi:CheY-like chemotaxis protein
MKADPQLRRIPVVVVSVLAGEGRGSLLGAVDLVTKPFEREDLLRVLWRHLGRTRGGRVLLLTSDTVLTEELSGFLTDRGLRVAARRGISNGFEALAAESPDAVLLEMGSRRIDTLDFIRKLRADRLYAGLPTFVIAGDGLPEETQDTLAELHAVVVPRGDPVAALGEVLSVLFPVADAAGHGG